MIIRQWLVHVFKVYCTSNYRIKVCKCHCVASFVIILVKYLDGGESVCVLALINMWLWNEMKRKFLLAENMVYKVVITNTCITWFANVVGCKNYSEIFTKKQWHIVLLTKHVNNKLWTYLTLIYTCKEKTTFR